MTAVSTDLNQVTEKYDIVIGIEVHCQLNTKSKMFSRAHNSYGAAPNFNIDPTSLGLPGSLPTLNEEGVDLAICMGLALGCDIQAFSTFSRKNYFYPDLPKGYQITQYDKPICLNGSVVLQSGKRINIERIQIEEDAGKNIHIGNSSLIDYNRAGVGLIEIVSKPDLSCPAQAGEYLKILHNYAVNLNISEGNLEKGHFRADANVSLKLKNSPTLGQRCEIKNVNSFKYLEKAILFEVLRQYELLEKNCPIVSETRGYDSEKNVTYSQRLKEDAHDYRYHPEPDLPPLIISPERIEKIRSKMPELPAAKALRFEAQYNLPSYDAQIITSTKMYSIYFEALVAALQGKVDAKTIANYFMTDILRAIKVDAQERNISVDDVKEIVIPLQDSVALLNLQASGVISGRIAKEIFEDMLQYKQDPAAIMQAKNLLQISDDAQIEDICHQVIAANQAQVEEYLAGKDKLFGFLLGQAMKLSGGKLNPSKLNEIMRKILYNQAKRN